MPRFLKIPLAPNLPGHLLIEVADERDPDEITRASIVQEITDTAQTNFQHLLESIPPFSEALSSLFITGPNPPESLELEFSLGIGSDASIFIAKLSANANFRLKLRYIQSQT